MILEAALRTPILTPKLLATRFRFPVWRSLLFSGGKRFVRCWTLLGPGDPLFDKWPYRGPWWARCSDTCFSRNTDPVFPETRTLFFQKHGLCFFKNTDPVFSKTWVQFFQKHGSRNWRKTGPQVGGFWKFIFRDSRFQKRSRVGACFVQIS